MNGFNVCLGLLSKAINRNNHPECGMRQNLIHFFLSWKNFKILLLERIFCKIFIISPENFLVFFSVFQNQSFFFDINSPKKKSNSFWFTFKDCLIWDFFFFDLFFVLQFKFKTIESYRFSSSLPHFLSILLLLFFFFFGFSISFGFFHSIRISFVLFILFYPLLSTEEF